MSVKGIDKLDLVGGDLALDFTNTVHDYEQKTFPDELQSYGHLVEWAVKADLIDAEIAKSLNESQKSEAESAVAALDKARTFRLVLYRVFSAIAQGEEPDQEQLNAMRDMWLEAMKGATLTPYCSYSCWKFRATGNELDSILPPIAHAAMNLLTGSNMKRVHECCAQDCTWLFVDSSKNRSRRWCQMEVCGNRAKAKRHYEKVCQ